MTTLTGVNLLTLIFALYVVAILFFILLMIGKLNSLSKKYDKILEHVEKLTELCDIAKDIYHNQERASIERNKIYARTTGKE